MFIFGGKCFLPQDLTASSGNFKRGVFMALRKVVVIAGPTASGKSQLAVDVARSCRGVVVNADSMQVYPDTPVLSAIPSAAERGGIEHCLYGVFPSSKNGTVVEWLVLAAGEICRIWSEGKLPVVCGGTGLYIDNLINGTTPIPEAEPEVRHKVAEAAAAEGIPALHARLSTVDAVTADRLNPNDSTRVKRALEVFYQTGVPLSVWHRRPMVQKLPEAEFVTLKILPPMAELDERCARRFDKMMAAGALDEVRRLKDMKLPASLPAMKALGVPELLDFLKGNRSLEEAVGLAKLHTRQYAKRQRTWFRNKLKADVVLDECYWDWGQISDATEIIGMVNN